MKKIIKGLKERFGFFIHKGERICGPFITMNLQKYISGHSGLNLYVGNYHYHLIYKF